MPVLALGDVRTEKIGQTRLAQIKKEKPAFQDVGTFTDGKETVVLSIKVVDTCKDEPLCKPLTYRMREQGQLVQYEVYNCYCGKDKRLAVAREKRKERLKTEQKKRLKLRDELETFAVRSRKQLREVSLANKMQRMRADNARTLRYGGYKVRRHNHGGNHYGH